MGCDIHLHTEVKIGGAWHHYSHPFVAPDYALFAKMMAFDPLSDGRGIPDDATLVTRIDFAHWSEEEHSASWLSSAEIVQLCEWREHDEDDSWDRHKWYRLNFGMFFETYWSLIHNEEENRHIPPEVEDVRWVFWFDN